MTAFRRYAARLFTALGLVAASAGCVATNDAAGTPSAAPATPAAVATASGLTIRYDEQAQFELTLPSGRRVYLDVGDPSLLAEQPRAGDVLLVTNMAPHHDDPNFAAGFPGQELVAEPGAISLAGLRVTAVEYSDREQPVDHDYPGGELFVIEAAGLRIVACGDLDQAALEQDQLAAIGSPVDVALCPIVNGGNGPDLTGKLALDVLDQMRPRLIVPTHHSVDGARAAASRWTGRYLAGPVLRIGANNLPVQPTLVFMGDQAANYAALLKLPPVSPANP